VIYLTAVSKITCAFLSFSKWGSGGVADEERIVTV
jgi:hypothetical protein